MNLPIQWRLLGYLLTASLTPLAACSSGGGGDTGAEDVSGHGPKLGSSEATPARSASAPASASSVVATSTGSSAAPAAGSSAAPSAESHWLALVSYENGQFKAERARRVAGPFRRLRDEKITDALTYVANTPSGRVVAGAPDPRTLHAEGMAAGAQQMTGREIAATGPQHLLLHVPEGTEGLELFETRALRERASSKARLSVPDGAQTAAAPGAVAPIASLSLKGLL